MRVNKTNHTIRWIVIYPGVKKATDCYFLHLNKILGTVMTYMRNIIYNHLFLLKLLLKAKKTKFVFAPIQHQIDQSLLTQFQNLVTHLLNAKIPTHYPLTATFSARRIVSITFCGVCTEKKYIN